MALSLSSLFLRRTLPSKRWFSSGTKSYYDVLGVPKSASQKDIRSAFLGLTKTLHPDRDLKDKNLHTQFVLLNEAYSVLSKPGKRRQYDQVEALQRQRVMRRTAQTGGSESAYRSPEQEYSNFRNETDFWTKDKDGPYYGDKGMKRMPKSIVAAGCFVIVLIGLAIHALAYRHSKSVRSEHNRRSAENYQLYLDSKERARQHGTAGQLQNLRESYRPVTGSK